MDSDAILSGAYWAELRTFLGLAKSRSINKTAEALGLSKATISRQMQRLQDIHDDALFVTSKRGVHLTDHGERLASLLLQFDHDLLNFTEGIRDDAGDVSGFVRVSVTDALGLFFVAPALPDLFIRYPRLRVAIKTPTNMKSLRENHTDILVTFSDVSAAADVTVRRLGTVHLTTIASREYVNRRGMPSLDTIGEHDFVTTERFAARGGAWEPWHQLLAKARSVHEADASLTYGMLVKLGLGIGLLTSFNSIDRGAVPVDLGVQVALPIQAAVLTTRLALPPTRVVFDLVCRLLSPLAPAFGDQMRLDLRGTSAEAAYARIINVA